MNYENKEMIPLADDEKETFENVIIKILSYM